MTTHGAQAISYDGECHPLRVDLSGQTIGKFAYDGDGTRRKRLDANGTIHYLGGYERNLGTVQAPTDIPTKYYVANFGTVSRLVAFRKNGTLYYVGTDHLGGTIRVADASFNPLDQMRYTPFGVPRDQGTNLDTDHLFTSQVDDQAIGIYWYGSRAYDATTGRFLQPDSIVPSPTNPQALNRYSYVLNSPLRHTDSTVHRLDGDGGAGDGTNDDDGDDNTGTGGTTDDGAAGNGGEWTPPDGGTDQDQGSGGTDSSTDPPPSGAPTPGPSQPPSGTPTPPTGPSSIPTAGAAPTPTTGTPSPGSFTPPPSPPAAPNLPPCTIPGVAPSPAPTVSPITPTPVYQEPVYVYSPAISSSDDFTISATLDALDSTDAGAGLPIQASLFMVAVALIDYIGTKAIVQGFAPRQASISALSPTPARPAPSPAPSPAPTTPLAVRQ